MLTSERVRPVQSQGLAHDANFGRTAFVVKVYCVVACEYNRKQ